MTEPRWSEAEIRAAFASAPYGLGVKAWLSADHLIAALSGVGVAPACDCRASWHPSPRYRGDHTDGCATRSAPA